MNINNRADRTYDAIVVGSGISGGWAAMELCKKGLKTLLLDRGRHVEHVADYPTAMLSPWELPDGGRTTAEYAFQNPIQTSISDVADRHFFANDVDHPYIQESPFLWYRGYQVGGRSLTWGRQCYRWSDLDFEANSRDGVGVDWPIRYRDIARWYDYVERFVGISGSCESLAQLPDGEFLPPMELNCIEKHLAQSIKAHDGQRRLIIARVANLTKRLNGRGACMNRNLCSRGCPFGAYFSSNSATIPVAIETGNLTIRPFSIVSEVLYDDRTKRATGVRVIDTETHVDYEFFSSLVFLNASTIATTAILLQSTSPRFPKGLGNDSGQVGRNLMDHHSNAGAQGTHEQFSEYYYKGRRPCGFLIPRFQNLNPSVDQKFIRGYNIQGRGERQGWMEKMGTAGFGESFKRNLLSPGPWTIWMAGWGECLPYEDNRVTLSSNEKDQWGLSLVKIDFSFRENEHRMMDDIRSCSEAMLKQAGFVDVNSFNYNKPGGTTVHEMGTARMGKDSATSVLNGFNQLHSVRNVFITDGSCMASSACQNPSLTYMALTARACDFAVAEMKKGNL